MTTRRRELVRAAGLLLVPGALLYFAFFIWPVARSFALSLRDWSGRGPTGPWVGLDNFADLLHDGKFSESVLHSVVILFVLLVCTNTVSLGLAFLLSRPVRFTSVYRSIVVLPYVLSPVVVGFIWVLLLSPDIGIVNPSLGALGLGSLRHAWLADPRLALGAVALAVAWQWNGLATLIFLAGLQNLRPELAEAARLDGAGRGGLVYHIYVPQLAPAFTVANVLAAVFALRAFDLVYVIGGPLGAPDGATLVMGTYIYGTAFGRTSFSSDVNMSYAMAQGVVQFAFVGVISLALLVYFGARERRAS